MTVEVPVIESAHVERPTVPPDWRMAYHAGIIDDTQAGRQAPHSNHAAAEGYA